MAQKTGRSFMPTIVVIGLLGLGAWFVLPKAFSPNGHRDEMVLLQVSWSPVPRQILVEHAIGTGDKISDHPTKGLWERLVPAQPGTVIYLAAFQDSPGTLMCRVKRGSKELVHDTNAGRGGKLANAVKCIT